METATTDNKVDEFVEQAQQEESFELEMHNVAMHLPETQRNDRIVEFAVLNDDKWQTAKVLHRVNLAIVSVKYFECLNAMAMCSQDDDCCCCSSVSFDLSNMKHPKMSTVAKRMKLEIDMRQMTYLLLQGLCNLLKNFKVIFNEIN